MNDSGSLKIRIAIAQRIIEPTIKVELEEIYRKAEKKIYEMMSVYAKSVPYNDHQDLMAMVLLDTMVQFLSHEKQFKEIEEEVVPQLKHFNDILGNIE